MLLIFTHLFTHITYIYSSVYSCLLICLLICLLMFTHPLTHQGPVTLPVTSPVYTGMNRRKDVFLSTRALSTKSPGIRHTLLLVWFCLSRPRKIAFKIPRPHRKQVGGAGAVNQNNLRACTNYKISWNMSHPNWGIQKYPVPSDTRPIYENMFGNNIHCFWGWL